MRLRNLVAISFLTFVMLGAAGVRLALAEEVCGDGQDNDSDGLADDGCYPYGVTGVCESPLSCDRHPTVAPATGNLVYWAPPDLSPKVPYGPGIAFRRVYMSKYAPTYADPSDHKSPMGYRWQHNYMSWLEKKTSPTRAIVHLTTGRDVRFDYVNTSGGYDNYKAQAGHYYDYLRQNTSTSVWELRSLTGMVHVYDATTGKLTKIDDAIGNEVTISYNGDGQVDTVLDASGNKYLEFEYNTTGKKLLKSVNYYTENGSTDDLQVTVGFTYTSDNLTTVKLGTTTMQTYTYTDDYLTLVEDGGGTDVAAFTYYDDAMNPDPGRVVQMRTGDGDVGYEYGASGCDSGSGTYVYYHHSSSTACSADGDCAGDEFCGGQTGGSGDTGTCFKVKRCLAMETDNEDLIHTVSAIGNSDNGTFSCPSCLDNQEYDYSTTDAGVEPLLVSMTDAKDVETQFERNSNGLVTKMVEDYGGSNARTTWYFYGDSSFPGLVTEIRRQSELKSGSNCSDTSTTDCKRTVFTYTSGGQLDTREELGFTLNSSGSTVSYDYTTDYSYDGYGRVTEIDGPLSTSDDVTDFTYWTTGGYLQEGYLKEVKRKKDSSNYVTTTYDEYDFWGNPQQVKRPSGDITCRTFDDKQGYLAEVRVAGNDQTSCSTTDSSDSTTSYERDTWGRLTKVTRPMGNCIHYEYDSEGRREYIKYRDDCDTGSDGDTVIFTYDANSSFLTEVQYEDDRPAVTYQVQYDPRTDMRVGSETYGDSTEARYRDYYDDGVPKNYAYENGLGKTEWVYDDLNRTEDVRKYTGTSTYETWSLTPGVQLDLPTQVSDPDSKDIDWTFDDLGRKVKQVTPDAATTYYIYDAAGHMTSKVQTDGSNTLTTDYTYDYLGRITAEDDDNENCGTGQGAEYQYAYDSNSVCPTGVTCDNVGGRLVYVKVKMWCDSGESDKTFDQETYYSYDNLGRRVKETIQDDGGRSDTLQYTYTKSGQLEKTTRPSGTYTTKVFDDSGVNSDGERPYKIQIGRPRPQSTAFGTTRKGSSNRIASSIRLVATTSTPSSTAIFVGSSKPSSTTRRRRERMCSRSTTRSTTGAAFSRRPTPGRTRRCRTPTTRTMTSIAWFATRPRPDRVRPQARISRPP